MRHEDGSELELFQKLVEGRIVVVEKESEGLPLINEDTRGILVSLYEISDSPEVPRYIPRYYDDEIKSGPMSNGLGIAEDLLGQFPPQDKSGYLYHLGSWLNNSFKDSYEYKKPDLQDSAIVGVGAVIKAFTVQLGYPVIEGLMNADGDSVLTAFAEDPIKSRTSLINRLLSTKDVPLYQPSLGSFINELAVYSQHPQALKEGAAMQYHVFESLSSQSSFPIK